MRVLALVTDAFGGAGGIAQYNRDFLTALAGSSAVRRIVALPRYGASLDQDLPERLLQLPPVNAKLAYAALALFNALTRERFDVVFCGHLSMAPLAALLAKLLGARMWLQIHGIEAWERPSRMVRWTVERAEQVTAVSRHTRRRFLSWANIEPWRVRVLPNTVDERFSPGSKPSRLVERYGLAGAKTLLTVSRLAAYERYKGHERVIEALPDVLAAHPECLYLIVGDGDDRERLEAFARQKRVVEFVRFAGQIPASELPDHYRVADVFLMPSTGEGFGIVFLEAAASGVAVIGGARDGSLDALGDGALGTAIDDRDAETLAIAIIHALDQKIDACASARAVRERFGRQSFNRAVDRLGDEIMRNARCGHEFAYPDTESPASKSC